MIRRPISEDQRHSAQVLHRKPCKCRCMMANSLLRSADLAQSLLNPRYRYYHRSHLCRLSAKEFLVLVTQKLKNQNPLYEPSSKKGESTRLLPK